MSGPSHGAANVETGSGAHQTASTSLSEHQVRNGDRCHAPTRDHGSMASQDWSPVVPLIVEAATWLVENVG